VKKVAKRLGVVLLGVILFFILLIGYTQTPIFRDQLKSLLLSKLDSLLLAEVRVAHLDGDLFRTVSLDSVSLKVEGEDCIAVDRIELHYSPLHLFRKTVHVEQLTLVNPRFVAASNRGGVWNIDRITRPTPEDTAASPFDWTIMVQHLQITDGAFDLIDSVALLSPHHPTPDPFYVEYHDVHLSGLNMEASVRVESDLKELSISKLSFRSYRPSFELLNLAGEFLVTADSARVQDLNVVTDQTSIELDATMRDFDLLGGIELAQLEKNPVEFKLTNSHVSLDEFKRFLPQVAFLGSEVRLELEAKGTFGELQLDQIEVKKGQTAIHAAGGLFNLHRPEDLYIDVWLSSSSVYSPDGHELLPGLTLPDYENLGVVHFDLEFRGTPQDFSTKFAIATSGGSASGKMDLAIGGDDTLRYKGDVEFDELNLAELLHSEQLATSLGGRGVIDGRGVDIEHLNGMASLSLEPSTLMDRGLRATTLSVVARGDSIEGNIDGGLGSMNASLSVALGRTLTSNPTFRIEGTVASLDLAELLADSAYKSNLTMRLSAVGTGISWSDVSGNLQLDLLSSQFREYQLDSAGVHVFIDQKDRTRKTLLVESSLADFSLSGMYELKNLLNLLSYQVDNLTSTINEKFEVLDTSLVAQVHALELDPTTLNQWDAPVDAAFRLAIKNLEPVSILTGNRTFNASGILSGTLAGSLNKLSVHAELQAKEVYYGNVESGFLVEGGSVILDLQNLKTISDPLSDLELDLRATAQSIHLNRQEFDTLALWLRSRQGYSHFVANGRYDHDVGFAINGIANLSEDLLVFTVNELRVTYEDLEWMVDGGSALGFGVRGVRLRNVVARSDGQVLSMNGFVGIDGELEGNLSARGLSLSNLKYFAEKDDPGSAARVLEGDASFSVRAGGTLTRPSFEGAVEVRHVTLRDIPFGEIKGKFSYVDGLAQVNLRVVEDLDEAASRERLLITGVVPIGSLPEEVVDTARVALRVQSEGIEIGVLDPIIPTFRDLSGTMRCDLEVVGSPDNLRYQGAITLDDCKFVFVPNNIPYLFSARLEPQAGRIKVSEAVVQNAPSDERPGVLHIKGDFALKDFVPTDFNLEARGRLHVVKPESRLTELSVYGDLFVETGASGLRFLGSIDQSLLKGDVLVVGSTLVFPPTRSGRTEGTDFSLPVVVIDDTSGTVQTGWDSFREQYFDVSGDTTSTSYLDKPELGARKSFMDGLEYDLDVETSGASSEIRLIFSTLPSEELKANFQGKWSITGNGRRWIGELSIERASYYFYKPFDASGKVRYTGELMNPELDILAQYQRTRTVQAPGDSIARTEKVVVNLKITGTRMEPRDSISMTIDGVDYYSYNGSKSSDVESDAIAFILAGTFPLSSSESNTIAADIRQSVGTSLMVGASSVLTSKLSDFLRRETTGFIQSVELGYSGQGPAGEAADIRLSGSAFKGFWRYQGAILGSPFSNSHFSLLYSFGEIFENPSLRNLMLELERREEIDQLGSIDERKDVNSARLFYRLSF
jgi:hypothetical protein